MKSIFSRFDWFLPLQGLKRMFNLNDSRWGRGDDKSGESVKPSDGASEQDPPKAPAPDRRPSSASSGPPDLDELWRDFNRKLSGLFGGKSSGGGGGTGGGFQPGMKGAGVARPLWECSTVRLVSLR